MFCLIEVEALPFAKEYLQDYKNKFYTMEHFNSSIIMNHKHKKLYILVHKGQRCYKSEYLHSQTLNRSWQLLKNIFCGILINICRYSKRKLSYFKIQKKFNRQTSFRNIHCDVLLEKRFS